MFAWWLLAPSLAQAASKMSPENLAIVFAPCLFRNADLMKALANAQREIVLTVRASRSLSMRATICR